MVYVFDMSDGLVKILKKGKGWAVYRLKEVQWWRKVFADPMRGEEDRYKFIWETKAIKTHPYKPFESGDVSDNPNVFIEDVRRFQDYKIRYKGVK